MPVFWLSLLVGCASEPKEALGPQVVHSDGGAYTLTVELDPDPPTVGEVALRVEAAGLSSLAMDGGMSGMDHGFTDPPAVTGPEGDLWTVSTFFSMSGTWELIFELDGDAGLDSASMDVEVY